MPSINRRDKASRLAGSQFAVLLLTLNRNVFTERFEEKITARETSNQTSMEGGKLMEFVWVSATYRYTHMVCNHIDSYSQLAALMSCSRTQSYRGCECHEIFFPLRGFEKTKIDQTSRVRMLVSVTLQCRWWIGAVLLLKLELKIGYK